MTSGQATFGDFLWLASSELTAARTPTGTVTPGRDAEEVATGILDVATVLTRYTADGTKMLGQLSDPQLAKLSVWPRAGMQAHDLLTAATATLRLAGTRGPGGDGNARTRPARQLHSAARALGAGRDLLQSHFLTHRSGARVGYSGWALVIVSPAVARAQLTEIASLARQSAVAGEASLRAGYPSADTGERLATACQLLHQATSSIDEANRSEPATQAERELLRAIPANVMPPRAVLGDPESVPALCQAVVRSAQRASHAAWKAAELGPHSTAISVASWHRIAAASMVTSHHCQILCATLADRTGRDSTDGQGRRMAEAAAQAAGARETWLDLAQEYREITTDIRDHVSPAAAEAAELALWTGRLAYANPAWNLSSGPSHPARSAEALAPQLTDVPEVVGAIHHASDAVAQLATANLEQAKSAVRSQRVLVPTRFLPEKYDVPNPYYPAPVSHQTSLLMCCEETSNAARKLAGAAAEIAIETSAPSRTLAAATEAARVAEYHSGGRPIVGGIGDLSARPEAPGPIEEELRSLRISSPRALWHAAALDRARQQLIADAAPGLARRLREVQAPTAASPGGHVTQRAGQARRAGPNRVVRDELARDDLQAEL